MTSLIFLLAELQGGGGGGCQSALSFFLWFGGRGGGVDGFCRFEHLEKGTKRLVYIVFLGG